MKKRRNFKLLSKTSFIYLIFTFVAFFISAVVMTREADQYIYNELERQFSRYERGIRHYLENVKDDDDSRENDSRDEGRRDDDKPPRGLDVTPINGNLDRSAYPVYSDTMLYISDIDQMVRARKKTVIIDAGGELYKAEMVRPIEDVLKLRDDIFGSLIPAFILLAIGIVGFNYLLSGYIFRPFNKILDTMKTYKIGRKDELPTVKTTTSEFVKMQNLFQQMINRIEYDYQHLKEYTENMAHEIQTPLTVIRNKTEHLIDDELVMNTHSESVKTIYHETNHLSKLGITLNLLTKIENNEFTDFQQIDTKPVLEKHVSAIEELAHLKSLDIETDLSEQHSLYIDPFLLDIALKNLLRNAISYGDGGSIRVKTTDNELIISNYGPPLEISEEKLFERFYTNGKNHNSLGLGLALVKKICELNELSISYRYQDDRHIFTIKSDKE